MIFFKIRPLSQIRTSLTDLAFILPKSMTLPVSLEAKLPRLQGRPWNYWALTGGAQCAQLYYDAAAAKEATKAAPCPAPLARPPAPSPIHGTIAIHSYGLHGNEGRWHHVMVNFLAIRRPDAGEMLPITSLHTRGTLEWEEVGDLTLPGE